MKRYNFQRLMSIIVALCFFVLVEKQIDAENRLIHAPHTFGKTHFIGGFSQYDTVAHPEVIHSERLRKPLAWDTLFSPDQAVCDKLCELILQEKSKILIAVYTLTDIRIAKALIAAYHRGVFVEIITDRSSPLDRASKIGMLYAAGIPIFLYQPPLENNVQKGLMHNKFAIFFDNADHEKVVWHGSFNFTRSGYFHNCESVVVMKDHGIFSKFASEYERIKQKSIRYSPEKK